MTEAEKIVREAWKSVQHSIEKRFHPARDGSWFDHIVTAIDDGKAIQLAATGPDEDAWQAALAFTRERQEQVRLLDEEIDEISTALEYFTDQNLWATDSGNGPRAYKRTIERLQETRKALTQGMSGKKREE